MYTLWGKNKKKNKTKSQPSFSSSKDNYIINLFFFFSCLLWLPRSTELNLFHIEIFSYFRLLKPSSPLPFLSLEVALISPICRVSIFLQVGFMCIILSSLERMHSIHCKHTHTQRKQIWLLGNLPRS